MSGREYFQTIEKTGTAEFKDRGSRFIAYAFPIASVEEFKKRMDEIKKEHPKATHHCFAYRIGNDNNIFRSSDAGEPAGTAGKPILGQIDSRELTNTLVVVVRYFGGTQLGVPGLINAYKTAASLVLQVVPSVQKSVEINYELQFDYTQMNEVMTVIKKMNCTIQEQEMNLFCRMKIGVPKSRIDETVYHFGEIRNMVCTPVTPKKAG